MKVAPIYNHIQFRSNIQDDENVIGFDDDYSRQTREFIREHYNEYRMPYQSIYETEGRKTEYQLQALLSSLTNKPKKVDDETIMGLSITRLSPIGNNSYRGATLVGDTEYLHKLKEVGIERVIDLVGYDEYKENITDVGLDYYCFKVFYNPWESPMFGYIDNVLKMLKVYDKNLEEYNKKTKQKDINEFVKFIQTMQKGNLYIGCQCGTSITDCALLLNSVFNPKANKENFEIYDCSHFDCIRGLYYNLSDKDKEKMGWTEKFDKNFLPRLQRAEEQIEKRRSWLS